MTFSYGRVSERRDTSGPAPGLLYMYMTAHEDRQDHVYNYPTQ